ncbi:MAG: hypothetical protein LP071_01545 [Candidatus Nanogingivalaceae bacterium]|nr:hypothetical protein [Candidatus Nanogingivalaceae bacterium]
MNEVVASPVLEELPTIGEAGGEGFDVFSSLRGGSANGDFSTGIDSAATTAGADGSANDFDLVAVANGEETLDAATGIDSEKSASETTASRISAVCTGMASAACLSCAARGDCSLLRMWGAAESRRPDPERQSYVEELLSDDNNLVVAGYTDSREQKDFLDSEEGYSSEQVNNAKVTVNAENTTSEPESSFKDDLADDGNKESSVKPTKFFDKAERAEKLKKPEGSEESGQPRMEATHDNPKEQTDENKQPLSVKHETPVPDNANPDDDIVETETLVSEKKNVVQETPVAIAPEAAPAVVSTAPKPGKPEIVDKSPAANHSQGSQPGLSKKTSTEVEDKVHEVSVAAELAAAVAGASTENPAPAQKISDDSNVITPTEREQKVQSQNLESLKTAVDDTPDEQVAVTSLNAENNAGSNSGNPTPLADTRQHDKLDALDTVAATGTNTNVDTDTDSSTLSHAAEPERSAVDNHSTLQTEDKPFINGLPSSPHTNDYGNEAPVPSDSPQKDIEKESARIDNGSFVSLAKVGDLAGTMSAAEKSASATEQGLNLGQKPATDNEPNTTEISTVVEPAKLAKHSENISPTEQSTNDVLNTTNKEATPAASTPENDTPLGKPATRKADFIPFQDGDTDNTQAATYSAVDVKPAVGNKTVNPQEATANWASEDEIFVVKQSPEMSHFADDEIGVVDLVSGLSLPPELSPDPEGNMKPDYKSDNIEKPQQTTALPNESETVYVDLRSGRATGEDSAAKTLIVADQTTIKPETTLLDSFEIADGESDDIAVKNTSTDNGITSTTVVKDVATGSSIANDIASGMPDFEQNSELPVDFSDQTQAADYDDPARQSASNDEAEDTHRIAFAHHLSGLWADDSQLNPELTAITTSQSNISDISLVSRLVGMAVVALCVMRGRRSARV